MADEEIKLSPAQQAMKDAGRPIPAPAPAAAQQQGQQQAQQQQQQQQQQGQQAGTEGAAAQQQQGQDGQQQQQQQQQGQQAQQQQQQQTPEPTVNDDLVKKYLKEKYGADVDDLEKLTKQPEKVLTEEEKRAQDEKIREEALKFAITKNKFSAKDLEAFSKETQRKPEDLVFDIMKEKWKKDDPTLSEEDMQNRFDDYFKLNEAEDSWTRQARYPELLNIANNYFVAKYPAIANAQAEYQTHLQDVQDAEAYRKRVDRVFSSYKPTETFELEVPADGDGTKTEKKTYSFSFSQEAIDEVKAALLEETSFAEMRGQKDEGIQKAAELALLRKEFSKAVTAVAREHGNEIALRQKAGRKGIIPQEAVGANGGSQNIHLPASSGAAAAALRDNKRI